jgi:predicted DNA-binding transcriptional regulator AlpA
LRERGRRRKHPTAKSANGQQRRSIVVSAIRMVIVPMATTHSSTHAAAQNTESLTPATIRLIDKREILAITGLTYPTIWKMMRSGTFPRSRIVGQKSKWRSDEVEQWLDELPIRKLKGDEGSA